MAKVTFNIPDPALPRIRDAMLEVYPNTETMSDPAWIDPGDGSLPPQVPKYTDNQWMKEVIRRWVVRQVRRGETAIAKRLAADGVTSADGDIT